jgi:hypothetical protein
MRSPGSDEKGESQKQAAAAINSVGSKLKKSKKFIRQIKKANI